MEEGHDHADDRVAAETARKDLVHPPLAKESLDEQDERPCDAVVDRLPDDPVRLLDAHRRVLSLLPSPLGSLFPLFALAGRRRLGSLDSGLDVAFLPKGILLEEPAHVDGGIDSVLLVDAQVDGKAAVAGLELDDRDAGFRDDDEGLRGGDGGGEEEGREAVEERDGRFQGRSGHRRREDDEVDVAAGGEGHTHQLSV